MFKKGLETNKIISTNETRKLSDFRVQKEAMQLGQWVKIKVSIGINASPINLNIVCNSKRFQI